MNIFISERELHHSHEREELSYCKYGTGRESRQHQGKRLLRGVQQFVKVSYVCKSLLGYLFTDTIV